MGEPDLSIRDLLDHLEAKIDERSSELLTLFAEHDPSYQPAFNSDGSVDYHGIKGLAWRDGDQIIINPPRPFIKDLNQLLW